MKRLNDAIHRNKSNSDYKLSFIRYQNVKSDQQLGINEKHYYSVLNKIPNCLKHVTSQYI